MLARMRGKHRVPLGLAGNGQGFEIYFFFPGGTFKW